MANESISAVKDYKPPKPGQRRLYRLLGLGIDPVTKGFSCPNTRRITNKFLIRDKNTVVSYVYVSHQDPSTRSDSIPASQRGNIVFTRAQQGLISIHGDRPDMFELDKALFFHQQNISNKGKAWHVIPKGGNYTFETVDKTKKATASVEMIERRLEAEKLIYQYNFAEIKDLYELVRKSSPEGLTEDEVRGDLYEYAQDESNAKALLILKDDEALEMKKIIREARNKKLIENGTNNTSVIWTKGKELICTKLPRKTIDQSLMMYFVTDEGIEVLKTLKGLTEAKK